MSSIELRPYSSFPNVYHSRSRNNIRLYTLNRCEGKRVYGESLINYNKREYREWDPFRSKLAALLLLRPNIDIFIENQAWLYLGASSGTTVSHLSDMLSEGIIFGIEVAERSIRQLIQNTSQRNNIIPILGNANFPETYARAVFKEIDIIYQDIAQPNQSEIAIKNCNYYIKKNGYLIFAIKSQSIDSIKKSESVYRNERKFLESNNYEILQSVNIHKFAANHIILIAQRKI